LLIDRQKYSDEISGLSNSSLFQGVSNRKKTFRRAAWASVWILLSIPFHTLHSVINACVRQQCGQPLGNGFFTCPGAGSFETLFVGKPSENKEPKNLAARLPIVDYTSDECPDVNS